MRQYEARPTPCYNFIVGSSLGARRGLLLRGGNILEKFSMVNMIVFDKTGTLTIGRPVVTKVVASGSPESADPMKYSTHTWSDIEVLKFVVGVEANTVHPISKAIVEAAQAAYCQNGKLLDALELSRLTMKTVKQNLWWAFAYNIVGIPIAAGMLLPVTGTILTPSIAGALMGLSSIGVMANSLLLRFRFSSKQKQISGASPHVKINVDYDQLLDSKEKMKYPISDSKWRRTR